MSDVTNILNAVDYPVPICEGGDQLPEILQTDTGCVELSTSSTEMTLYCNEKVLNDGGLMGGEYYAPTETTYDYFESSSHSSESSSSSESNSSSSSSESSESSTSSGSSSSS